MPENNFVAQYDKFQTESNDQLNNEFRKKSNINLYS